MSNNEKKEDMNEKFEARELYDVYRVTIKFRDKVCGGMPKNKDLIEGWVKATTGYDDEKTKELTQEAKDALLDETTEKSWNGFRADENGLYLETRQVKALFKECATMLRITTQKLGSKQIFQHGFEIKGPDHEDRLYLKRRQADGYDEGPIHVMTAQGPRTALKRVDYVKGATISFEMWVFTTESGEKRHVGEKEIAKMLTFGQENGIGADRSQGRGKFNVVEFEKVK